MSGRLTTAREPRERGCSGSEMGAMRSLGERQLAFGSADVSRGRSASGRLDRRGVVE